MKTLIIALRLTLVLTLFTGVAYPLVVWGVGQAFFRTQAEGSLVRQDGKVVGSILLAQKTASQRYFWPRPSGADFATVPSGATNLSWTSATLATNIAKAGKAFREANHLAADATVPAELVTASGSGLDPDLSPEAIRLQEARVAQARHLNTAQQQALDQLIAAQVQGGQLGPAHVNVLALNLELAEHFP
jgi:K+-transporting ATPase ATPase C chain